MVQLGNYKGSIVILKKSLLYFSGLLGLAFYCSGSIFIDRGNSETAKKSLNSAREEVVRDKVHICTSSCHLVHHIYIYHVIEIESRQQISTE